jgi:hypothetical protein
MALSLIHTLYKSLQHAACPLSVVYLLRLSPGNVFQRLNSYLAYTHLTFTPHGSYLELLSAS